MSGPRKKHDSQSCQSTIRSSTVSPHSNRTWINCIFILALLTTHAVGQTKENVAPTKPAPATSICLTKNGQLISGSDNGLQVHDVETLKPIKKLDSEIEKQYSIVASPDGSKIAVTGGTPSETGTVEIFSVPDFNLIKRFIPFDDIATDVAWRSDDELIAACSTGNCCKIDLKAESTKQKDNPVFNVHSRPILSIKVLKSQEILSAGKDNSIRVWKPDAPKQARVLNNHIDFVFDLAVRPSQDDKALPMIASVSKDGTARFWQPTIGRMIRFGRLDSIPSCVAWNQDGTAAIIGCRDGTIVSVNPETAKPVGTTKSDGWIYDMALHGTDQTLIIATENGLRRIRLAKISN